MKWYVICVRKKFVPVPTGSFPVAYASEKRLLYFNETENIQKIVMNICDRITQVLKNKKGDAYHFACLNCDA